MARELRTYPGEWASKLALALGSLLTLALVLELLLRFALVQGGPPDIHRSSDHLGHELVPDLDFVHLWDARESRSQIRINALGLRGRELPARVPGDFRILLLGDSYTFGYGVGDDETFAQVLESSLNGGREAPATRYVVINAGVSGYGTTHELLQFETKGRDLRPDLVVLNLFVGNDLQDNLCLEYLSLRSHGRPPCFSLEDDVLREVPLGGRPRRRTPATLSVIERIRLSLGRSELFDVVSQRGARILGSNPWLVRLLYSVGAEIHPGYLPHVVGGWYVPEHADRGWKLTQSLLRRLHGDVLETGARLAVVIIPSRTQVLPRLFEVSRVLYADSPPAREFIRDPWRPQRLLTAFLDDKGIPSLDLGPEIAAYESVEDLYFPIISHWNHDGHRLAARAVLQFLVRERLIGSRGDEAIPLHR